MKLEVVKTLVIPLTLSLLLVPSQIKAQLVPRPWVSVGVEDDDVTFSIGARAFNWGAELGTGPDGAIGVDILRFIGLPLVSPYVGIGLYSEDEDVAFSGGVQVSATDNLFLGIGYNSVRGVNGQVGLQF